MALLWSLRGLSTWELLKRTAHESWNDEIFGRSARLAFYFFFALFPALLLLLLLLSKTDPLLASWRAALLTVIRQVLPPNAASMMSSTVQQLNGEAVAGDGRVGIAVLGAIWGALNGTHDLIQGINKAYEVEEKRLWWRLVLLTCSLALSFSTLGLLALAALTTLTRAESLSSPHLHLPAAVWDLAQWLVIALILFLAFSILYRFGPNLNRRRWQWSFPGAAIATVLWIAFALLLRAYQSHSSSSQKIYGNLSAVSTLLLWLYLTGGAIFIGGEANSEIEKTSDGPHIDSPHNAKDQRSGGHNN